MKSLLWFFTYLRYAKPYMPQDLLKTYLRTYRRRTGLTQDEVAFLVGAMSGTMISRHERGKRLPLLETALAYEFILQASVRDLYLGVLAERRAIVQKRARGLCRNLERKPPTPLRAKKIALLKRLIGGEERPSS